MATIAVSQSPAHSLPFLPCLFVIAQPEIHPAPATIRWQAKSCRHSRRYSTRTSGYRSRRSTSSCRRGTSSTGFWDTGRMDSFGMVDVRVSFANCSAATDFELGHQVAIKRINQINSLLVAKRTLRELKLLRHFQGHPNVHSTALIQWQTHMLIDHLRCGPLQSRRSQL